MLNWIENFLLNRIQRIKINNVTSSTSIVRSGVPQGSVLGPTLFLLYINDLVDVIQFSDIRLFADDLKIFNTSENHEYLQTDLNNLNLWANTWQLPIAFTKCTVLYLGKSNPMKNYKLGDFELKSAKN